MAGQIISRRESNSNGIFHAHVTASVITKPRVMTVVYEGEERERREVKEWEKFRIIDADGEGASKEEAYAAAVKEISRQAIRLTGRNGFHTA